MVNLSIKFDKYIAPFYGYDPNDVIFIYHLISFLYSSFFTVLYCFYHFMKDFFWELIMLIYAE